MKTLTLVIENDDFADILQKMLEQMQFVKVYTEKMEPSENLEASSEHIADEPSLSDEDRTEVKRRIQEFEKDPTSAIPGEIVKNKWEKRLGTKL